MMWNLIWKSLCLQKFHILAIIMNFIDIHNHFAWDIDDGMESKEQAMLALEGAKKDGVQAIISTPHFIQENKIEKM